MKKIVLEHRGSFEDEWGERHPGARREWHDRKGGYLFKTDEKQRNIHIYYSDYRKARERSKLQGLIREQREQLESLVGSDVKIESKYVRYFDLIYHRGKDGKQRLQFIRGEERYHFRRHQAVRLFLHHHFRRDDSWLRHWNCIRAETDQKNCSVVTNHILEKRVCGYIMTSPHTAKYLLNLSA